MSSKAGRNGGGLEHICGLHVEVWGVVELGAYAWRSTGAVVDVIVKLVAEGVFRENFTNGQ